MYCTVWIMYYSTDKDIRYLCRTHCSSGGHVTHKMSFLKGHMLWQLKFGRRQAWLVCFTDGMRRVLWFSNWQKLFSERDRVYVTTKFGWKLHFFTSSQKKKIWSTGSTSGSSKWFLVPWAGVTSGPLKWLLVPWRLLWSPEVTSGPLKIIVVPWSDFWSPEVLPVHPLALLLVPWSDFWSPAIYLVPWSDLWSGAEVTSGPL
jgi:hypothetical protein